MRDLIYFIPANSKKENIIKLLQNHPEIAFVSMLGVDLAGNDTDEKIPVKLFIENIDDFYDGSAVQTDGSSVVLTDIATLNDAKVDIPVDPTVNWYVDYNYENISSETGTPVGTLRIPGFLIHNGKRVGSRSILHDTLDYVKKELLHLLQEKDSIPNCDYSGKDIEDIFFTVATELEFWIKTPLSESNVPEMSASQVMQEQYWQRTRGSVRTALENTILLMQEYGLEPEMGHKEVGGMKAHMDTAGNMSHICEQVEIDWKFSFNAVQAADNELLVRTIVKEVFRSHGLEVIFKAKPIIGLAGNGEHTHIGIVAKLKNGKFKNLFAPQEMTKDFMSPIGYGALMGLLKNYEVINPLVSSTNDSLNRLKPGFEAPVCIVTSLGHSPKLPSRNRTILVGLIRDINNPMATRFELRACNPYTNTYLALSAIYSAVLDGIRYAIDKTPEELLAELSKEPETVTEYLETGRAYRSEVEIFEDYTEEERNARFGKAPSTVWENMQAFQKYPDKLAVLTQGKALNSKILHAFMAGELIRWKMELISRIIPENKSLVQECHELSGEITSDLDRKRWHTINTLRLYLAKDTLTKKSLFSRLREALLTGHFSLASKLQVEMYDKIEEMKKLYFIYESNIY